MFSFCECLKEIDLSNFIIKDISIMLYMFKNCKSLKLINLSNIKIGDGKYTDLIFKNIAEDCKIICQDKIGLKKEILKYNQNINNNMIFSNINYYETIEKIAPEECAKLKKEGIKFLYINSKNIFYFIFIIAILLGRDRVGKTTLIET